MLLIVLQNPCGSLIVTVLLIVTERPNLLIYIHVYIYMYIYTNIYLSTYIWWGLTSFHRLTNLVALGDNCVIMWGPNRRDLIIH